ncbi:RusA family crossover junction endodeoxyribonuclease [Clostridium tetani]|uniref:RusA family crossover junction endodeoxyribonuclease n=1 Tax=Clostridium tetani TaxID=1513 RepID=UPI0038B240E2
MIKLIIPGELPDLNKIINVSKRHYMAYRNLKKEYTDLITLLARGKGQFERIDLDITWYCKNKRKDKDNIAVGIKFILDGLVEAKVIKNDGWKEVNNFKHTFKVDKDNPRIEVEITEVTE